MQDGQGSADSLAVRARSRSPSFHLILEEERGVRNVLRGQPSGARGTLSDPEALGERQVEGVLQRARWIREP